MSNSAVFFVPAARSCARVVALPRRVSPPRPRCRCRRCGGGARRHLGDSGRSGPLMRGGGAPTGALVSSVRSRVRGATTAPLRRGTVPLRAGPLSALHRGDFRPGIHAAVSGSGTPEPPANCPRQATRPGGRDPGPPGAAVRAAAAGRHSPLRLQDRLRRRPSGARMRMSITASIRSQKRSRIAVEIFCLQRLRISCDGPPAAPFASGTASPL